MCVRGLFPCTRLRSNIATEAQRNFSRIKVFIRFLVKVPNFPIVSDTYVYLCIIYHNVSRAVQFMYISVTANRPAGERKKMQTAHRARLPRFCRRACARARAPPRRNFVTVSGNRAITITESQHACEILSYSYAVARIAPVVCGIAFLDARKNDRGRTFPRPRGFVNFTFRAYRH